MQGTAREKLASLVPYAYICRRAFEPLTTRDAIIQVMLQIHFFTSAQLPTQEFEELIRGTALLFSLCHDFSSHRCQAVDPSKVIVPPSGDGGYVVIPLTRQWLRGVET